MNREFTELPPLSLYVHIPWCVRKCPYCDFNSHEARGEIPEQAYVDALLTDLAEEMPSVWGRTISTVFIGGGTPSLFSAKAIDQLMSGIRALTGLHPNAEVTMEANPGTFEQQRFKDYRDSGINRLSIGVQSFNGKALQTLGRVHSADEAIRAVNIAQRAGFDKINLDLMFGLPEQTVDSAMDDLAQALSLGTTHLSCYELTLEPNTLFARFPPKLPSDDLRADMQNAIVDKLREHQFERYEISAYAKSDATASSGSAVSSASRQRASHNVNYWQFGDYLGIGAGAHAKISSANTGEIVRQWKHKHPTKYLNAETQSDRIGGQSVIPVHETGLEFMMNALRLIEGFPIPLFEQHTGVSMMPWQKTIESATQKGLLEQKGLNLRATPMGINWLNSTLELFLDDVPDSAAHNGESNNAQPVRRYPIIPLKLSDK
jgi:putative oxygen-independent coproporphyrinogen III oxidase